MNILKSVSIIVFITLFAIGCGSGGGGGEDPPSTQTTTVSGTVFDDNGNPIEGAEVTIMSDPVKVFTNAEGKFSATVEIGTHTLEIKMGSILIHSEQINCEENTPLQLSNITTNYDPDNNDIDDDGDSYTENQGDCNDSDNSIYPSATEICDGTDNNCDGSTDEGCDCTNGSTRTCGSNTGECSTGTQTCVNGQWNGCSGEIGPATEICDDGIDQDCNGSDLTCPSSPMSFINIQVFTETVVNNPEGREDGWYLHLKAIIDDPLGVPNNIQSVEVVNLDISIDANTYILDFTTGGIDGFKTHPVYGSQRGTYRFTAVNNQGHTIVKDSAPLDNPVQLDTINFVVSDNSTTPIVTFDTVDNADKYRLSIFNESMDQRIYQSDKSNNTSFVVPAGEMTVGETYYLRAEAFDINSTDGDGKDDTENRSANHMVFIPEYQDSDGSTASGNITVDSPASGQIELNITSTNFACGPDEVKSHTQTISFLDATTMTWLEGEMTWIRDTGDPNDIRGTWRLSGDGVSVTLVIASNYSFTWTGTIDCGNSNDNASIIGTWYISSFDSDAAELFTFEPGGIYWYAVYRPNYPGDPGIGFQHGTYSWDATSGELTIMTLDSNTAGDWGFYTMYNNIETATLTIQGADEASIHSMPDDNTFIAYRLKASTSNPILGTWLVSPHGQTSGESVGNFIATPEGYYMLINLDGSDDVGGQPGIEYGTYSFNPSSGVFAVTPIVDTSGDWGISPDSSQVTLSISGTTMTSDDQTTAHRLEP